MAYILDILACGFICFTELVAVCLAGILIQAIVYRTTKFSIWNWIKKNIEKEIYNTQNTYISIKNKLYE